MQNWGDVMSDRNLGERETNLRGNAIGKTRRSNKPGEPTGQHRREETTKKVASKSKNQQYAAITREQQNWEDRTKKQKQGRRDRGHETGRTQGLKRRADYKRQEKNNRRDTIEQRNRSATTESTRRPEEQICYKKPHRGNLGRKTKRRDREMP